MEGPFGLSCIGNKEDDDEEDEEEEDEEEDKEVAGEKNEGTAGFGSSDAFSLARSGIGTASMVETEFIEGEEEIEERGTDV